MSAMPLMSLMTSAMPLMSLMTSAMPPMSLMTSIYTAQNDQICDVLCKTGHWARSKLLLIERCSPSQWMLLWILNNQNLREKIINIIKQWSNMTSYNLVIQLRSIFFLYFTPLYDSDTSTCMPFTFTIVKSGENTMHC